MDNQHNNTALKLLTQMVGRTGKLQAEFEQEVKARFTQHHASTRRVGFIAHLAQYAASHQLDIVDVFALSHLATGDWSYEADRAYDSGRNACTVYDMLAAGEYWPFEDWEGEITSTDFDNAIAAYAAQFFGEAAA